MLSRHAFRSESERPAGEHNPRLLWIIPLAVLVIAACAALAVFVFPHLLTDRAAEPVPPSPIPVDARPSPTVVPNLLPQEQIRRITIDGPSSEYVTQQPITVRVRLGCSISSITCLWIIQDTVQMGSLGLPLVEEVDEHFMDYIYTFIPEAAGTYSVDCTGIATTADGQRQVTEVSSPFMVAEWQFTDPLPQEKIQSIQVDEPRGGYRTQEPVTIRVRRGRRVQSTMCAWHLHDAEQSGPLGTPVTEEIDDYFVEDVYSTFAPIRPGTYSISCVGVASTTVGLRSVTAEGAPFEVVVAPD